MQKAQKNQESKLRNVYKLKHIENMFSTVPAIAGDCLQIAFSAALIGPAPGVPLVPTGSKKFRTVPNRKRFQNVKVTHPFSRVDLGLEGPHFYIDVCF